MIEIGLPLHRGGFLWLGPWCEGHAEYLKTAAPGVATRRFE